MASRPIVPQQHNRAEGNTRRALGDIGNLVTIRGLENKKQVETVIVDGGVVAKGLGGKADQKKITVDPKPMTMIIEISPDTQETKKEKSETRINRERPSSRKKVNTLTSVLTARSKVACGLTYKPKDSIVNIDAADINNQLAAVEYVEDIYKFYKLTENLSRVHDYMSSQHNINEKMREILVDWLIEVHYKFELMPETLYLTIHILDRYLSIKSVLRREFQLVGISAMLIACKYEEIWAPQVNDFICLSYTREQILAMEKEILGKLEWTLTVPTPYVFLVRFIKAAVSDQEMENMAFFLAELGLMQYGVIMYCPSMLAASAVYAARCTLNKSPLWSETLQLHTGFSEPQLMDCAKLLVNFHSTAAKTEVQVVHRKYSNPCCGSVALLPPAKNLLA